MTGKRFEYKNHKVYDNMTGETHSSNMVSVSVLNELHEENIMLKGELAHYKLILMSLEEQAKRLSEIHCVGDKE